MKKYEFLNWAVFLRKVSLLLTFKEPRKDDIEENR